MKKFLFVCLLAVFFNCDYICVAQSKFELELLKLDAEKLGINNINVYKCRLKERQYSKWENSNAMMVGITPNYFLLQESTSVFAADNKKGVEKIDNFVKLEECEGYIDFNNSTMNSYTNRFVTRDGNYMFLLTEKGFALYNLNHEKVIEKKNDGIIYSFNRIGRIVTTSSSESDMNGVLNVYSANILKREDNGGYYLEISQNQPSYRNLSIIAIENIVKDYQNKNLLKHYTSIFSSDKSERRYEFTCRGIKTLREKVLKTTPVKHTNWVNTKCMVIFDCTETDFFGQKKVGTFCCIFNLKTFDLEGLIEIKENQLIIPSKYEGLYVLAMYDGHIWKYNANGLLQWEKQFAEKGKEGAYNIAECFSFDESGDYSTNIYISGTSTIAPYVGYNNPVIWEINGVTQASRKIELSGKGVICANIIARGGSNLYIQVFDKEKGIEPEYRGNDFVNPFYDHIKQLMLK